MAEPRDIMLHKSSELLRLDKFTKTDNSMGLPETRGKEECLFTDYRVSIYEINSGSIMAYRETHEAPFLTEDLKALNTH